MKKTLLTLFTVALFNFANAQVSAYTFAGTSGTYAAITGGTLLGGITSDETNFVDPAVPLGGSATSGVGFPIGFNFTYNGLVFNKLAINNNGWISLGQSALTPSVDLESADYYAQPLSQVSTATPALLRNRIAALAMDLQGQTGSSLRIQTTGTTPNQICVIQWTGYREYNSTGDNFNFQIRLKETSNSVEIVYGTFATVSTSFAAQVGLSGTTPSDFNLRTTTTNWAATTVGTVNTAECTLTATVKPTSGQTFTWSTPPVCTGAPTAGTASGPTAVCSGVNFDLVLTGYTPNVSGLTFQWQSSTTLGGTYSNISGAITSTYTATQTTTMYYKCLVSCSGGTAVASTIVTVTMNTVMNCFCTSTATSALDEEIFNVTVGTLNNSSTCATTGGAGSVLNKYSNYTGIAAPNLPQSTGVPFSIQIGTCGTGAYKNAFKIFIDYNQNGSFAEAGENAYISDTASGAHTETGVFTVPSTATLGNTLMRIVSTETSVPSSIDSCGTYSWGETEDYLVNIIVGTACSGTPTVGTASATDSVCNGPFDLILTGYTSGVMGITFQWQSSSTSGGTYTNITGATTPIYAATQSATTYYKCVVTCSGGTPVTSNVVTVYMIPVMDCYCTSTATSALDEEIFNVTVGTLNNSSTCATTGGAGSTLNKYSNYTAVTAPILSRTAANSFSVQIGTCGTGSYKNIFKIFIDYNKNGSFAEAGETVYTSDTASGAHTVSGSFTVPTGAASGNTLMRVVCRETSNPSMVDSCGTYSWGETEDYFVNIPSLVGIEENEMLNTISVYPNPTTGLFNITTSNANFTQLTISVMDIQGKEVFSTSDKNYSANYNKQINLEGLAKGIYFIRLNTGAAVKTQKLIIQ